MPLTHKIAILFLAVGFVNYFLRGNRNWIFGYRSGFSLKTHKRYAFANKIASISFVIFGTLYLALLYAIDVNPVFHLSDFQHVLVIISFLAILIAFIEIRLRQEFKEE